MELLQSLRKEPRTQLIDPNRMKDMLDAYKALAGLSAGGSKLECKVREAASGAGVMNRDRRAYGRKH